MATNPDKKISSLPDTSIFNANTDFLVRTPAGPAIASKGVVRNYATAHLLNAMGDSLSESLIPPAVRNFIPITILEEEVDVVPYQTGPFIDHSGSHLCYCRPLKKFIVKNGEEYFELRGFSETSFCSAFFQRAFRKIGESENYVFVPSSHVIFISEEEEHGLPYSCCYKWDGYDLVPIPFDTPATDAFDGIFNALCRYNASTSPENRIGYIEVTPLGKVYHLNGLELTLQEAYQVVADALRPGVVFDDDSLPLPTYRSMLGRTNFLYYGNPIERPLGQFLIAETLRLTIPSVVDDFAKQGSVKIRCHTAIAGNKIHTIYGKLIVEYNSAESKKPLFNLPSLENVDIKIAPGVKVCDLSKCKKLSLESLQRIVNNVPTGLTPWDGYEDTVYIVLHADVFDKLTYTVENQQIYYAASDKGISFTDSY